MRTKTSLAVLILAGAIAVPAYSQSTAPNPTQQGVTRTDESVPVFRVTVVARTTPAINYRHRGGATTIDLEGTSLLPRSHGEAKVESKQGYIEIEVEFDELEPATRFGPEYLTYVMWAITPEGRATNLGEVLLNGSESKLNVTSELQMFGLVVTAEPYFAVSQPSDVVVMENRVRGDTRGKVEVVEARYELLKRGTYRMNASENAIAARRLDDDRAPLELHEARNAILLSRLASADRYAADVFGNAERLLAEAERAQEKKRSRKTIAMVAREAVQRAEDARLIAIQRQDEERLALEREAAARREAQVRADLQSEADRRARAEADRQAAEQARLDAERATERTRREAEMAAERARREADAIAAQTARERAAADAARLAAEQARAEAEAASAKLRQEREAAEAARQAALAETERMRQRADAAERDQAELRAKLQAQLNSILETREDARGLIVSMPDVLFDFDRYSLRQGAREKLARVAGIVLAYPDLRLEVEGHTDSLGTDEYNQRLSERRADSVLSYLREQGINPSSIVARGFGEARPIVTNDTAEGRQQNRRVELVVSGESIGVTRSTTRR
jgi:outer membrane protein OmpA-like peptidoglycan-associated protein